VASFVCGVFRSMYMLYTMMRVSVRDRFLVGEPCWLIPCWLIPFGSYIYIYLYIFLARPHSYHDNRILPPHITAEESLTGNWWYKPEYIFNELNINSVIAKPDHNETLSVAKSIDTNYEMVGYAYTGGGRKITRVEISTDAGVHWELATIERKEHVLVLDMVDI
jgi:Mo-co oxidoreductase dimerisation domain